MRKRNLKHQITADDLKPQSEFLGKDNTKIVQKLVEIASKNVQSKGWYINTVMQDPDMSSMLSKAVGKDEYEHYQQISCNNGAKQKRKSRLPPKTLQADRDSEIPGSSRSKASLIASLGAPTLRLDRTFLGDRPLGPGISHGQSLSTFIPVEQSSAGHPRMEGFLSTSRASQACSVQGSAPLQRKRPARPYSAPLTRSALKAMDTQGNLKAGAESIGHRSHMDMENTQETCAKLDKTWNETTRTVSRLNELMDDYEFDAKRIEDRQQKAMDGISCSSDGDDDNDDDQMASQGTGAYSGDGLAQPMNSWSEGERGLYAYTTSKKKRREDLDKCNAVGPSAFMTEDQKREMAKLDIQLRVKKRFVDSMNMGFEDLNEVDQDPNQWDSVFQAMDKSEALFADLDQLRRIPQYRNDPLDCKQRYLRDTDEDPGNVKPLAVENMIPMLTAWLEGLAERLEGLYLDQQNAEQRRLVNMQSQSVQTAITVAGHYEPVVIPFVDEGFPEEDSDETVFERQERAAQLLQRNWRHYRSNKMSVLLDAVPSFATSADPRFQQVWTESTMASQVRSVDWLREFIASFFNAKLMQDYIDDMSKADRRGLLDFLWDHLQQIYGLAGTPQHTRCVGDLLRTLYQYHTDDLMFMAFYKFCMGAWSTAHAALFWKVVCFFQGVGRGKARGTRHQPPTLQLQEDNPTETKVLNHLLYELYSAKRLDTRDHVQKLVHKNLQNKFAPLSRPDKSLQGLHHENYKPSQKEVLFILCDLADRNVIPFPD